MKTKPALLVSFLIAICSMSFAQTNENYYSYSKRMSHYYDSVRAVTPDTVKVPGWRQFQRWNDFWRDRVYNSPTVKGSYNIYETKLKSALISPAPKAASSSNWNWQLAGNQNLDTHNKGLICSLWINPSNIDEIYAGSNTSGLFRTTIGGASWECVTDNIDLPSMGVNDIAVNPQNTNIKYIAHSGSFGGGAAYIHKTSDNCVSWQTVLTFPASAKKAACRVVIDPTNPNIVYALMLDVVYRSMDAETTWQLIFNKLTYSTEWYDSHKMLLDIEFKPDDHNTVYITGNGYGGPVGKKIYYVLQQAVNGSTTSDIWRMNTNGSERKKVIEGGLNSQPNLADYNSALPESYLFYVHTENNIANIYRYIPTSIGDEIIQLTSNMGNNVFPRVNSDQSKLLFISNRTGIYQIFSMNIDGTNVNQLTTGGVSGGQNNGKEGGVCWTPDGKILYINGTKIYKMNVDGTNVITIATAPSYYWSDIRCSPAGKIAAQTQGGSPYITTIYIMNSDGSGLTTLVPDDSGGQGMGNFSEDGTTFYYCYDVSGHEETSGLNLDSQIYSIKIDGTGKTKISINKPIGYNESAPCAVGSTFAGSAEIWVTTNATSASVIWQRIKSGLPEYCDRYAIAVTPSIPSILYIGYSLSINSNTKMFNLKKLTFPGNSISHMYNNQFADNYSSPFGGLGNWRNDLELSPSNPNILFCGGFNLEILNILTQSYTFVNCSTITPHPSFHVDQRVFKTATANSKTYLFCGNDGGVSRYEYDSGIMNSCNGPGLDNNQYYGIGHSEVSPDFYIGGTQDNGVIGNGSGTFKVAAIGDAYEVIVDPVQSNIVFATANGGSKSISKSSNFGQNFTEYIAPIAYTGGLNDRPFMMSPLDRNTIYVGYSELYKTINGGTNWSKISDFHKASNLWSTTNEIKAIGLSKADPNQIVVAFTGPTWATANEARLFKTTNGGQTWIDLSASLGNTIHWTSITDIMISPVDKNKIWITFGGYWTDGNGNTINKVYFSSNGGTSWTDITINLPDLPVVCANGIMGVNAYTPIIGNDLGIFMFDNEQNTWQNISTGLPHTIVSDIEVDYTNRLLLIGTYGRGIWKAPIPCSIALTNTIISTNTVWTENQTICGDIIIESGSLTIASSCTVTMNDNAQILVKSGGELKVDGGKIMNTNIQALSGSNVIIKNNGCIKIGNNGEFNINTGATSDYQYGTIDITQ